MLKKIFINVFFEKRKILVAFIIIFTLLLIYSGTQLIFLSQQSTQVAIPDFQINGKLGDDGVFYFRMYNDMDGLNEEVKGLVGNEMRVYGVTVRNLLTMDDANTFQKIYYSIYGVEDSFFNNELANCLKSGRLPKAGEKEALIGSCAARYFNVNVGDKLNKRITLNKDAQESDSRQYTVSGILNDNVEYFKGGIFISKETFEVNNNIKAKENLLLTYFKDSNSIETYNSLILDINKLRNKYNMGTISVNYEKKYNIKKNIILTIASVLFLSLIILFLLISYLMKGITKKIGLLKALGISDFYITKTFLGGLGLSILISFFVSIIGVNIIKFLLNYNVSSFLGYKVEQYFVSPYIYFLLLSLGLAMFFMVYILIKIKSSRISPRDAMLKV